MIQTKEDRRRYLAADARSHGLERVTALALIKAPTLRWQRLLRWTEYADVCWRGWKRPAALALRMWWLRRSVTLGFDIPLHVFEEGLSVPHWGTIVVSPKARVGPRCRLHASTNIGENHGEAPTIGADSFIGPGAKLFGGITLGDKVGVGANAVVLNDVPSITTVAGVPARPISGAGFAQA